MAEARRYGLTPQLDINQIQVEAQSRWLRPVEICEILKNYQRFQISPEPPNRPPSGSLFLFDRKVLRYFRKDGHNWRKKRDGKTVKEAHEKLKAGSVDVLHCYYAHGEENPNFQRRTYWMLEEEFMHIVLVHYREVKDKKETYGRTRDVEEVTRNLYDDRPVGSNSSINYHQILSSNADGESQNSGQTSEYEDAEQDTSQASSRYHPLSEFSGFDGHGHSLTNINRVNYYPHLQHSIGGYDPIQRQMAPGADMFSVSQEEITTIYDNSGFGVTINGPKTDELSPWEAVWKQCAPNFSDVALPPASSGIPISVDDFQKTETVILDGDFVDGLGVSPQVVSDPQGKEEWQEFAHVAGISKEGNLRYATLMKQLSLDFPNVEGEKGLQKHDSFSKWITRELGDVDDTPKPSTRIIWDVVEGENGVEDSCLSPQQDLEYLMSPSLSQDQLFSINYVTPSWAFADSETTVFVSGTFLTSKEDIQKVNWSCMFGQNEVFAEAIGDGLLRCVSPVHKPGRIPFYVTCSNRLACSEVREFEFHADDDQAVDSNNETLLYLRLERLLSSTGYLNQISDLDAEKISLCNKISSLLTESNYCLANVPRKRIDEEFTSDTKDEPLQKFLIEKLHAWLLQKVTEDGKGPNIIDKEGQGVIHLAAALDYDWAIAPIVAAGVNINFRDARGWTALHWAAAFGREKTIVALLSLDADPGLLTDPTPEFPSGRTPADLSSSNGHKGIAGFLAESSLTKHLSNLDLKESGGSGIAGSSSFVPVDNAERNTNQSPSEDLQSQQSLKDSLGAVRNAAQAYARIYQVYRMQSFHRKKLVEYEHSKFGGLPEEEALSLIATKANKVGQRDDPVHAAATRIQNKFRGWKGRKDFLVIRQHIVKIQAHIRGYQVRKHYRKVVWSVLIVEKAILRWRRKGSGLRGFRSEGPSEVAVAQVQTQPDNSKEDDYEYLRAGRKQTEARLERALARVKSMVQYPEARDQYQRLAEGVKESKKAMLERILSETEETNDDLMFDIDELVAEDAYMATT